MASKFVRFAQDRRGTTFEGIALSVAIVAVAFVASADMLDFLIKKHTNATEMVAATPAAKPATIASSNLDYAPTALVAEAHLALGARPLHRRRQVADVELPCPRARCI